MTKVHKSLKIDSWQICFSSPSVSPSRRQTMPQPLSGLLVAIIIIIIIIIIVTIIIVIVIIVILREAPQKDNRFYLGHQLTQTCEPTPGPLTQISRFGSFTMNLPDPTHPHLGQLTQIKRFFCGNNILENFGQLKCNFADQTLVPDLRRG